MNWLFTFLSGLLGVLLSIAGVSVTEHPFYVLIIFVCVYAMVYSYEK